MRRTAGSVKSMTLFQRLLTTEKFENNVRVVMVLADDYPVSTMVMRERSIRTVRANHEA